MASKRLNFENRSRGLYVNRLLEWGSYEEWFDGGFEGKVALRMLGGRGDGPCIYEAVLSGGRGCWVPDTLALGNILLPHDGGGDVVEVTALNCEGSVRVLSGRVEMILVKRLPREL